MTSPDMPPRPTAQPRGDEMSSLNRIERRRERIVAEIQANRRGEYRVPTWVYAAVLAAIVMSWTAFVLFG